MNRFPEADSTITLTPKIPAWQGEDFHIVCDDESPPLFLFASINFGIRHLQTLGLGLVNQRVKAGTLDRPQPKVVASRGRILALGERVQSFHGGESWQHHLVQCAGVQRGTHQTNTGEETRSQVPNHSGSRGMRQPRSGESPRTSEGQEEERERLRRAVLLGIHVCASLSWPSVQFRGRLQDRGVSDAIQGPGVCTNACG